MLYKLERHPRDELDDTLNFTSKCLKHDTKEGHASNMNLYAYAFWTMKIIPHYYSLSMIPMVPQITYW